MTKRTTKKIKGGGWMPWTWVGSFYPSNKATPTIITPPVQKTDTEADAAVAAVDTNNAEYPPNLESSGYRGAGGKTAKKRKNKDKKKKRKTRSCKKN